MITEKEVQRIAKLARLGITKTEEKKFQKELFSILDYMEKLKEVKIRDIEPTSHSSQSIAPYGLGIMREDKVKEQSPEKVNKLIAAAPKRKGRYIKVKAVL